MRRAFVIGHPVAHSRSPLIHGHWLREHGIAGSYERIDVPPAALADFLRDFPARGFVGGNVTVPHKEEAAAALDVLMPVARRLGAVNTLSLDRDGRIRGDNTDGRGFTASLDAALGPGWSDATGTALLLGAGGARAIAAALLDAGVGRVRVANRSAGRAAALCGLDPARMAAVPWPEGPNGVAGIDLLVNTTSLGMAGEPPLALDLSAMPDGAAVADIVYVPLETALLAAARRRGLAAVDGLGMLLHQAVPGFAAWFGVAPVVTPALRAVVEADLGGGPVTVVLGLTGSIGMGKSATAGMFRRLGVPVHDADAAVHALYRGAAAPLVEAAFPGTVTDRVVDRTVLGQRVIGDPEALRRLERIVHPLVRAEEEAFLRRIRAARARLAVLDVPLLLEGGRTERCDAVLVVTAPASVQHARVLARPGMTAERLAAILAKQMPDADKRARAHFVVDTSGGLARAEEDVAGIVRALAGRPGRPVRPTGD